VDLAKQEMSTRQKNVNGKSMWPFQCVLSHHTKKCMGVIHDYSIYPFIPKNIKQVHSVAAPFTSHLKLFNYVQPKPFSWAKPTYFDFSLANCTLEDHILSTIGDARSRHWWIRILFLVRWLQVLKGGLYIWMTSINVDLG
jgi:hypothetical protein